MEVGKRITELRLKKDITTNKLANLAGISQSYLRDIELGKTNPTVEKLEYICEVLGISLSAFFDNKDDYTDIVQIIGRMSNTQRRNLKNFIKSMK